MYFFISISASNVNGSKGVSGVPNTKRGASTTTNTKRDSLAMKTFDNIGNNNQNNGSNNGSNSNGSVVT